MTGLDDIIIQAQQAPRHIVLAEGSDPRIIEGATKAASDGIARITLLGSTLDSVFDMQNINPETASELDGYADEYFTLRQHKGVSLNQAKTALQNPINFANMMVRQGHADGSIAGAVNTTADVVRSALQILGVDQNYALVSSFFLMIMPDDYRSGPSQFIFSDCGLVVSPTAGELVDIAAAAADNARLLFKMTPKVALLSFATGDSAHHADVDKIIAATLQLKSRRSDLSVDGPLQFDAAIATDIAARKAPKSDVAGRANVLIFPDLNAGNIGYKITERLGGAKAIGPILQGLNKPANDLSRGCSAEDVYNMIAVTCVQAQTQSQAGDS